MKPGSHHGISFPQENMSGYDEAAHLYRQTKGVPRDPVTGGSKKYSEKYLNSYTQIENIHMSQTLYHLEVLQCAE